LFLSVTDFDCLRISPFSFADLSVFEIGVGKQWHMLIDTAFGAKVFTSLMTHHYHFFLFRQNLFAWPGAGWSILVDQCDNGIE